MGDRKKMERKKMRDAPLFISFVGEYKKGSETGSRVSRRSVLQIIRVYCTKGNIHSRRLCVFLDLNGI